MFWDDPQNHTFRHTLFCQDGIPNIGLSETYDEDELFSFDFSQNTRVPRLPDFAEWAQGQGDASAIAFDKSFCEMLMREVSQRSGTRSGIWGWREGCHLTPANLSTLSLTFPTSWLCLGFSSLRQHFSCQLQSVPCFVMGRRQLKASKSIELHDPTACILITVPGKMEG